MATATIQGIRSLSYPPQQGEHYLSVNLALVTDVTETLAIAKSLGFSPELVQISTRFGTEIHALLFHEQTNGEPLAAADLDAKVDQLADLITTDAIRHTYGGRFVA